MILHHRLMRQALVALCLAAGGYLTGLAHAQTSAPETAVGGGPIRLQPAGPDTASAAAREDRIFREEANIRPAYAPGEFEAYVQRVAGDPKLRRFGSELVIEGQRGRSSQDVQSVVPPDYRVAPGDELLVALWGAVDADLRLTVDRSGRILIPRVGSVMVAGTALADLHRVIDRQARQVFKNFELSVSLGQIKGIRVFVTGHAVRPGAHNVSGLSTLSSALFLKAGGPSASGSFRDIELRRGGRTVARLDLYDLLLFGRRDADQTLQADDVIHIGPVASQVALIGSVNKPAVFELKAKETLNDLIAMGGGFSPVADRSRMAIERMAQRLGDRVNELTLPRDATIALGDGDILRAFSSVDAVLPLTLQNKRVRVEGEVRRPGDYILPASSSLTDAVAAAGGLAPSAFVFGTEFARESVRASQQVNFDRALREMELEITKKMSANVSRSTDEAGAAARQQQNADRIVQRLRDGRPTGRVVLQLSPEARELPALALEDGDRIYIPATPTSVGVFGSVFNSGNYLYQSGRKLGDYLQMAGSPTRTADLSSIFVVRANGNVVSAQATAGGWFSGNQIASLPTLPGDTVFVPEDFERGRFLQGLKDWTQILSQFGLGIAGLKVLLP